MSGKYYWTSNPISDVYSGNVLSNRTYISGTEIRGGILDRNTIAAWTPVGPPVTVDAPSWLNWMPTDDDAAATEEELKASDKDIEELLYGN